MCKSYVTWFTVDSVASMTVLFLFCFCFVAAYLFDHWLVISYIKLQAHILNFFEEGTYTVLSAKILIASGACENVWNFKQI